MRPSLFEKDDEDLPDRTDDELAEEVGLSRGKVSQLQTASIRPASL